MFRAMKSKLSQKVVLSVEELRAVGRWPAHATELPLSSERQSRSGIIAKKVVAMMYVRLVPYLPPIYSYTYVLNM